MSSHTAAPGAIISSPTPLASTSTYLIKLATDFVNALNDHDFEKATSYTSVIDHSCFSAQIMFFPKANNFEEHINIYRQMAAMAPHSKIRIMDITTNIDKVKGFADVYVYAEIENGWRRQGVSQLQWVRKDGVWLCFKHDIVQGVEDIV